jgi:hypothetical protein
MKVAGHSYEEIVAKLEVSWLTVTASWYLRESLSVRRVRVPDRGPTRRPLDCTGWHAVTATGSGVRAFRIGRLDPPLCARAGRATGQRKGIRDRPGAVLLPRPLT